MPCNPIIRGTSVPFLLSRINRLSTRSGETAMFDTAILIIIGMFIGWNFPQPAYAKLFQEWILTKWARFRNK